MSARSPLAVAAWRLYTRWRVRRGLDGVYVAGLAETRARLAEGPVVFAATHVAWWDGLVMLLVDEALGAEGHVLVEASTLRRLPWLRSVGALALDRGGLAARAGLRAAAAVLDRPGRAVWIFPQGRQRPPWLRPLGIRPGVGLVARASGAPIVPVALTYTFREGDRPAALVHLGSPVPADRLEEALVAGLEVVDRFLDPGAGGPSPPATPPPASAGFFPIVASASSRTDRGLGARLLSLFSRSA